MNTDFELTIAEQSKYQECLQVICQGPATADAIGEALWRIATEGLYRGMVHDMYSFFYICLKPMEPEDGFRIIEEWMQTPRGQEVISEQELRRQMHRP